MQSKVISFDGDNTLWDFDAALRSALGSVLERLSQVAAPVNSLNVDRLISIREEVGVEWGEETASLRGMRKESLRRTTLEAGADANANLVETLFETFMSARDRAITPYSDVAEMLTALRSDGWTIALLTNGNANPHLTGIGKYLDVLLYAEEIGVRKPHREAFEAVSNATGCALTDLIHVGDSLESDVAGARDAGSTAIWINRTGLARVDSIEPHYEITTMAELLGYLDSR